MHLVWNTKFEVSVYFCTFLNYNTSPERENALSAGYVPVLSKCAPSSCYTQQRLGKILFLVNVDKIDEE